MQNPKENKANPPPPPPPKKKKKKKYPLNHTLPVHNADANVTGSQYSKFHATAKGTVMDVLHSLYTWL